MPSKRRDKTYPAHIGSILTTSFSSLGLKAKLEEYGVRKVWAGVVGKNISKRSRPKKLIGGTLHVIVSSSSWMTELQYHKKEIISKLNERLGSEAVEDIVFKAGRLGDKPVKDRELNQRPLTPQERLSIERTVSGVKDDALRELIKRVMEKGKTIED